MLSPCVNPPGACNGKALSFSARKPKSICCTTAAMRKHSRIPLFLQPACRGSPDRPAELCAGQQHRKDLHLFPTRISGNTWLPQFRLKRQEHPTGFRIWEPAGSTGESTHRTGGHAPREAGDASFPSMARSVRGIGVRERKTDSDGETAAGALFNDTGEDSRPFMAGRNRRFELK